MVFVHLPDVGQKFELGQEFGAVESVKASVEVYAPVCGTVTETNARLEKEAKLINTDPMKEGWLIRLKVEANEELDTLMNQEKYETFLKDDED